LAGEKPKKTKDKGDMKGKDRESEKQIYKKESKI